MAKALMVGSKHFTLGTVVLLKVGKILILDKTLLDLYKGQHAAPGFSVWPTLEMWYFMASLINLARNIVEVSNSFCNSFPARSSGNDRGKWIMKIIFLFKEKTWRSFQNPRSRNKINFYHYLLFKESLKLSGKQGSLILTLLLTVVNFKRMQWK